MYDILVWQYVVGKGKNMTSETNFNGVVLLLLFGIYFVLSFINTKNIPDLIYGVILIIYYVKFRIIQKKCS